MRAQERQMLRAKYLRLCRKYRALVGRLEQANQERLNVFTLSWWALRGSAGAFALLADGAVLLANERLGEWNRPLRGHGAWQVRPRAGSVEPRPYSSLRALMIAEAQALRLPGAPTWSSFECQRIDDEQTLEVALETVTAPGGDGARVIMRAYDVSERVRAERELAKARLRMLQQESVRIAGELAAGLSHDLNNLLSTMSLRIAQLHARPTEEQFNALRRTIHEAGALVGRMNELARQHAEPTLEPLQPAALIQQAIRLSQSTIRARRMAARQPPIDIKVDLQPELPLVRGDALELRRVLLNLLLNASDAMPDGGSVDVLGSCRPGWVHISVTDQGSGIPPALLTHIFEPFFTTKGEQGTGLGLAMVGEVMLRLGGTVEATNCPHGGACFELRLPALAGSQRGAHKPRTPSRPRPHTAV